MTEVKSGPNGDRSAPMVLLLVPIAVLALWWTPRAARPTELPTLVLPAAEVRAALRADAALAEHAPTGAAEDERRRLYLEEGRHEVRGDDSAYAVAVRQEALLGALVAVVDESGDDALAAARMADVLRLERAIGGEGTPTERAGEAGLFVEALTRWGAVEEERVVAPAIVVRALAIARWNAVFSQPLTDGLSPIHARAYHGWLALHGAVGWTDLRELAFSHYEETGGHRTHEARGILFLEENEPDAARREFERAEAMVGSIRLRNYALYALERSAEPTD